MEKRKEKILKFLNEKELDKKLMNLICKHKWMTEGGRFQDGKYICQKIFKLTK